MFKSCALILVFLLAVSGQGQFFNDADDYIRHYLNWRTATGSGGQLWPPRPDPRRDIESVTERDREPLSPDYSGPRPQTIPASVENVDDTDTGIIDVDAISGLPGSFPAPESAPGFSNYGGVFPEIFNIFGNFRSRAPWWNGPNVCIEREETTENEDDASLKRNNTDKDDGFMSMINLSSCHQTLDKYECVTKTNNRGIMKTFTIKYRCCYGFKQSPKSPGCIKVDLKNLVDTIQEIDASVFKNMIHGSGLEESFRMNNYTVFVPIDKALSDFGESMNDLNQVDVARRRKRDVKNTLSTKDLILNHVVNGFVDLTEIVNEQKLASELKGSTIRLNVYPTASGEKLITANCAPVRKANVLAQNGIVHVIDGVVPPATTTIMDVVENSSKLRMFRKVLKNVNLKNFLGKSKSFTLLAPTDEAFEALHKETKEKLLNGDDCALNILKYHIIPHTVCSSAINGNVTTHNVEGEIMNFERREDDRLIIDGKVEIVRPDIIASDGVIHYIDTVLLPDSGLHIMQILKKHNFTRFERLVRNFMGLADEMNDLKNSTFFIPINKAFTNEIDEIIDGDDKLPDDVLISLIKYHISPQKLSSFEMKNNQQLETGIDEKARINLYSTLPIFSNVINRATINCAKIVTEDKKSCSSLVHIIDKVLIPPTQTLYDIIMSNNEYSILQKIINGTVIEDILKNNALSVTFLAPTNDALSEISEKDLEVLFQDKKKATDIMLNHVLKEVLCCSGVGSTPWNFNNYIQTMAGQSKEISRNSRHQVRVGASTITKCDIIATNGVIHEVNRVMFPIKRTFPFQNLGLFFFDF